ncbi:Vacuolar sorting-associated 35 [Schistosoma japonicum]|nr:Vacuolar sorting-associated 35 [Schistosoma japonicum]
MLDPLTRPGEMTLTDAEVLKDNTWQRFFLMLSAKVIGIELGDLMAALLLPIYTYTENPSEIDTDTTTYDNTKLSHQCQNELHHLHPHHPHHHHLHQHDLNSIKQCSMNSDKQNSLNRNLIKYEKLNDLHKHLKCLCKSEFDLRTSIPNSLFCSNNKLTNQHCNHSISNSFTNLHNYNYDRIRIDDVDPILEHRSYV